MTDDIFEKKKHENESNKITNKANLEIFISSIFLPTQIKRKLLNNVAEAYIDPNWPCVMESSFLILSLKSPKKKTLSKTRKKCKYKTKYDYF